MPANAIAGDPSGGGPKGSPPLALERAVRAARLVERVQRPHVGAGETEIEDLGVLGDSLALRRLGDHRDRALHRPAQENLGERPADAARDLRYARVAQLSPCGQRAVCLEHDLPGFAALEQRMPVRERAELDL